MPDEPVTLGNKIFFNVCGALADTDDAQTVFTAAFADFDQHLAGFAHAALFGDVLVALLDDDEEWFFELLFFGKQVTRSFKNEFVSVALVEIPRDIEDNGDVLFECKRGDLFGVIGGHLNIAFVVRADVEDFVLFFEAVVLAVAVDDEHRKVVVQEVFEHHRDGVRFPATTFAGDEAPARENVDDR